VPGAANQHGGGDVAGDDSGDEASTSCCFGGGLDVASHGGDDEPAPGSDGEAVTGDVKEDGLAPRYEEGEKAEEEEKRYPARGDDPEVGPWLCGGIARKVRTCLAMRAQI
jgi:hypothetical protein